MPYKLFFTFGAYVLQVVQVSMCVLTKYLRLLWVFTPDSFVYQVEQIWNAVHGQRLFVAMGYYNGKSLSTYEVLLLIILRCDEPMVVLDTHKDWRFAKNVSSKSRAALDRHDARLDSHLLPVLRMFDFIPEHRCEHKMAITSAGSMLIPLVDS